jgi:hypothetical protein
MAIVTDPDDLDRWNVCVNAEGSTISVRGLGAARVTEQNTGDSTGNTTFTDTSNGDFVTDSVTAGDILTIISGAGAAHYTVVGSIDATSFEVDAAITGTAADDLTYRVDQPKTIGGAGANVADGMTMQALYSFLKEEWRDLDSSLAGTNAPDLIKFVFPLESITREQFELGGATHGDWDFFDDVTRQLMRTGGWAQINSGGTTEAEYSGIITLGSVDSTAQVYYQQTSATTTPNDFVLTGPVNQAILTYDGTTDWRTYLKLFVRTKARTYEQSAIGDIGVTSLETIVNRFPLAHSVDVAITATDGALITTSPWTSATAEVADATSDGGITDPDTTDGLFTFTDAAGSFDASAQVYPGDAITFNSGPHASKTYEIQSVTDANTLVCFQEPAEDITADVDTHYTTDTRYIVAPGTTDGVINDPTPDDTLGTLTSVTVPDFGAAGVAAGDMVRITEQGTAGTEVIGIYKIDSLAGGDATAVIDIEDEENWVASSQTGVDFEIVEPGMYLQYKDATGVQVLGSDDTMQFFAATDECTRQVGSFISDGYEVGMAVTVAGTTNNNGVKTVESLDATSVTFVEDDTTNEGPLTGSETMDGDGGFYRLLGSNYYPFHWRLFGNGGDLGECFQYIQRQLRRTTDIDEATGSSRGDVTDLLMTFASPTGVALDLFIDDLDSGDFNNATFNDVSGTARNYPFIAGVTITLNSNIINSTDCKVVVFFTNCDGFPNAGDDFGTVDAIIVKDDQSDDMTAQEPGTDLSFSFDYDNNVQRGAGSGGNPAPITIVAIGTDLAQYVQTDGTIKQQNVNTFALVSPLERNYSNP